MENGEEDCCVKVAVHVRPLIVEEQLLGCKDCVTVVSGEPQLKIGTHSFTFDRVYGSVGSPSSAIFKDCVAPLVDGLFQGYNATVLAYGQTGSGKTYTMGTGGKDGSQIGIIHQVMDALFYVIDNMKDKFNFQLRVSFIEILKEEVRDLLDPACSGKVEAANGHPGKVVVPLKSPVQIRETSNGVITLTGSTEIDVHSKKEMATCLEQGSINRATGSTNMNNRSSRSHAIFTITLEKIRKLDSVCRIDGTPPEDVIENYLCAKLHLVDLAGSERAKRTGSDGLRFKEGVHINRGLLALGNVISALGDEKKRKEGCHVPYRDSKLTRLLQDSLGGNSRTFMIACVSPADINAEETLNTLKYANRARNIQNKPIVNRDPSSTEMLRMRQQIEYLQAELLFARGGGCSLDEVKILKDRISWLESINRDLYKELNIYRGKSCITPHWQNDSFDSGSCFIERDEFSRNLNDGEFFDCQIDDKINVDCSKEIDEELAKEWEHSILQNTMGNELNELNKRLEQKESEMKMFRASEVMALKKHFGKKLMELEDEKRAVQHERDRLLAEVESLSTTSEGPTHDNHTEQLKSLEAQIIDLKRKQENQVMLLKQKQKSDEAAEKLQQEIQSIKAQKVQLQHKIKQEMEQFRQWKASREKELLQLKKEGRRSEYEKQKLEAVNQRQKLVLQRKTEEAAMATKRLKELLEARKASSHETSVSSNGNSLGSLHNEKSMQKWLDHELEVMVNVHEVRAEYEKQSCLRAALAEEAEILKQNEEAFSNGLHLPGGRNGYSRLLAMSPNARLARITSLENMVNVASNTLVAMASQLSEAEERDQASGFGRWNVLRSVKDAKILLQHMFNIAVNARCQLLEKKDETRELKEQVNELIALLRMSDVQRKEFERKLKDQENAASVQIPSSVPLKSNSSLSHSPCDLGIQSLQTVLPAQKQLNYTPHVASSGGTKSLMNQHWEIVPTGKELLVKKQGAVSQSGKLWRWKRSHHRWLLEFKWKWQKPWKLSEWVQNSDEIMMRLKPNLQLLHQPG